MQPMIKNVYLELIKCNKMRCMLIIVVGCDPCQHPCTDYSMLIDFKRHGGAGLQWLLSAVTTLDEHVLNWLVQQPASKFRNQPGDCTLSRWFYTQEAFFECISHTGVRLHSEVTLENKNPLRLFKNRFHSSHEFTSTQYTKLFVTAVLRLSYVLLICTNTPLSCFCSFSHFLSSSVLRKFGLYYT